MKLPQLRASLSDGEGDVFFPPEFKELSWVTKADLLNDWIWHLSEMYRQTMEEVPTSKT